MDQALHPESSRPQPRSREEPGQSSVVGEESTRGNERFDDTTPDPELQRDGNLRDSVSTIINLGRFTKPVVILNEAFDDGDDRDRTHGEIGDPENTRGGYDPDDEDSQQDLGHSSGTRTIFNATLEWQADPTEGGENIMPHPQTGDTATDSVRQDVKLLGQRLNRLAASVSLFIKASIERFDVMSERHNVTESLLHEIKSFQSETSRRLQGSKAWQREALRLRFEDMGDKIEGLRDWQLGVMRARFGGMTGTVEALRDRVEHLVQMLNNGERLTNGYFDVINGRLDFINSAHLELGESFRLLEDSLSALLQLQSRVLSVMPRQVVDEAGGRNRDPNDGRNSGGPVASQQGGNQHVEDQHVEDQQGEDRQDDGNQQDGLEQGGPRRVINIPFPPHPTILALQRHRQRSSPLGTQPEPLGTQPEPLSTTQPPSESLGAKPQEPPQALTLMLVACLLYVFIWPFIWHLYNVPQPRHSLIDADIRNGTWLSDDSMEVILATRDKVTAISTLADQAAEQVVACANLVDSSLSWYQNWHGGLTGQTERKCWSANHLTSSVADRAARLKAHLERGLRRPEATWWDRVSAAAAAVDDTKTAQRAFVTKDFRSWRPSLSQLETINAAIGWALLSVPLIAILMPIFYFVAVGLHIIWGSVKWCGAQVILWVVGALLVTGYYGGYAWLVLLTSLIYLGASDLVLDSRLPIIR